MESERNRRRERENNMNICLYTEINVKFLIFVLDNINNSSLFLNSQSLGQSISWLKGKVLDFR